MIWKKKDVISIVRYLIDKDKHKVLYKISQTYKYTINLNNNNYNKKPTLMCVCVCVCVRNYQLVQSESVVSHPRGRPEDQENSRGV